MWSASCGPAERDGPPGVVVTPMLSGAADLQVELSVGEWVPITDGGGEFVVENPELVEDPDETPKWTVTSRVSSTFEQAQDQVTAIAVLRDDAGEILGGVRTLVSDGGFAHEAD